MPHRIAVVVCAMVAVAFSACHHSVLVVDNAPKPDEVRATISGTLTTPHDRQPVPGRVVTAVENTTSARFEAVTNPAGGFTLLVDPGTYRLEVPLQPGEGVIDTPTAITVKRGDIKSDITLTLGKVTR